MAAMDLKCGYLDFRNPSKEFWYTVRLWSRKWVQVRANTASEGLSVLLEAYEDQNEYDKIVVCILLEKVSTVRRSPIKNRYALEIFSGDRPLVYLAADSETVCHEWISVFKKALLPSMPTIRTLPDVGTVFHHVWALPMGSANKLRLNGEFLLAITGENFTLYNETGTLCLQWKLNHIRRFAVCNDKDISPADYGKILYVNTGSQCEDGEGEYYFYSIQAKDILQQILDKIGEAMEKIKLSQEKEGRQGKEQEIQTEDSADKNVEELVTELDGDRADGLAGNGSKEDTSLDNVSVNTSISWTSESSVGSPKEEKTCAETVLATAVNKNTTPSKETPSVAKEVPTGRAKSEHIGMSESTSGNVRTPPDGNDQSSDNYLVTSPHSTRPLANGDARIDFEPMAASPPSLSGTLLYPSPAVRLRGNSTSSSGYSSDPLEINGLYECSRSDHGHSDDAHSLTSASNSNVSFVSRFSERDSFQSDTSAFSFSSGPERLTKTRRNTFSGSNEKNYERDRDQITESNRSHRNRVIQRRSTLSSINELYRSREDDCNQAPFLKDIDNIMPKRSSVDSIGNSSLDEFDDNKTNDVISDTSVDESADIPAPFDLLDIYLLSARAKLMKDSETSADRGAGHVTNQVQPPTLPRRTSSLQVNSPLSVSTENKQQKTKEKGRQRRRSSIFTSLAEKFMSSTSSSKRKEKEAKKWNQARSNSCPSSPVSSPQSNRRSGKENSKSSKYKINLRWSKSNKQQYKSCQSLDQIDFNNTQQSSQRPLSFHGSRSTQRKLSKKETEILKKYCSSPYVNTSPASNFVEKHSTHHLPAEQPIIYTSDQSEPRKTIVRQHRIESLDITNDMDHEQPTTRTWKSMEFLSESPRRAYDIKHFNTVGRGPKRTNQTYYFNSYSSHIYQNLSRENIDKGMSSSSMHQTSMIEEINENRPKLMSCTNTVEDDVFDGYIDMSKDKDSTDSDELDDEYFTDMNRKE